MQFYIILYYYKFDKMTFAMYSIGLYNLKGL